QFGDDDPVRLSAPQLGQGHLETGAAQALARDPSVNNHLDQVEVIQLGVAFNLRPLGLQALAVRRLLLGAHSDVTDDLHNSAPRLNRLTDSEKLYQLISDSLYQLIRFSMER